MGSAPPLGGELGERMQLRRQMRKAVYENTVKRESVRIVEDILLPELLRTADESNHQEACKVLVPHVAIGPMSKDLPKSYRRALFEDDVAEACRMLLQQKGLENFIVSLERACDDARVPRCSVFDLVLVRCLPQGLPTRPLPAERCLTFTATLPSLDSPAMSPLVQQHPPPSPPLCTQTAWGVGGGTPLNFLHSSAPPVHLHAGTAHPA